MAKLPRKARTKAAARKAAHPHIAERKAPRLIRPSHAEADAAMQAERARFEAKQRAAVARAQLELDDVDKHILMWTLRMPGMTQEQIAEVIGYTRDQVNRRMNADKFKRALQIATRPALEIFESNKATAARVLGELLASPDDRIKIRAAIAHMWPEIHQGETKSGEDFVTFIQEAFERAQSAAPKASNE